MKIINVGNQELKKLFSIKNADHGILKQQTDDGFVVAKSRPGVAWVKAIFSNNVRNENKQVRQDFVQRLRQISENEHDLKTIGKSSSTLLTIIARINVNSGMPLSRKYLSKINSSVGLSIAPESEKGFVRKGIVIYRLFGKKAAISYLGSEKRKADREQQGFDESSLLDKLGSKMQKLVNRTRDKEYIKNWQQLNQDSQNDDLGGIDENLDNRC